MQPCNPTWATLATVFHAMLPRPQVNTVFERLVRGDLRLQGGPWLGAP